MAALWSELCDYEPFETDVVFDDAIHGRIEVVVSAPPRLLAALSEAAAKFAYETKSAFDCSVQAAAELISGVVTRPDEQCHLMPLCRTRVEFVKLVSGGGLDGLRGDQVQLIEQFQPFAVGPPGTDDVVGPTMLHLAEMVNPQRDPARPRLTIWAHSSQPEIVVGSAGRALESVVADDGPLLDRRTIATFMCEKVDRPKLSANPNVAFDPIFYDEPLPTDPDDNLSMRSWALRVLAREFIVAMQRSVDPAQFRPSLAEQMAARIRAPAPSLWGEVEFDSARQRDAIAQAFDASDLGLASYFDDEGNLTMLIRSGKSTYARPVSPALDLDPDIRRGTAAEDATLSAASIWGLPDFVMRPTQIAKGNGRREVGDGTIITGARGAAIQVKSRETPSADPERESSWLRKKAAEGARQAAGTIRTLKAQPVAMVNGRGRSVTCDGTAIDWVRVVIIDHTDLPETSVDLSGLGDLPAIVIARRDWDFLFEQLRSTSAVVDYLHRVARLDPIPVGTEPARYFELARADENTGPSILPPWMENLGQQRFTHPLLPHAPATSADTTGHTVFHVILEDIARTPADAEEHERLEVLALLDRFNVGGRAELGRLLLSHMDDVMSVPPGTTKWQFRRVIQDHGALQLAFGTCNQLTALHREAFAQWAMLRHHEYNELATDIPEPRTVAVLLTPRWDGVRPWDTTMYSLRGDLGLEPGDIHRMGELWNQRSAGS